MGNRSQNLLLLIPVMAITLVLLGMPLLGILDESFRVFVPGHIGAAKDAPLTVANYAELMRPAYLGFFVGTFRLSVIAAFLGLLAAYPIAYFIARMRSRRVRKLLLSGLVLLLFLSGLVRVYTLALTFGPAGYLRQISAVFGLNPNGRFVTECLVVGGLLQYAIPMSILVLFGTIQNVNPRLAEAATALGAPRWLAHLTITVPLSAQGIASAFLISFTFSMSAFVIPMVLGKGQVLFVSNLIYSRFSEASDYPSGAAIAIVMTLISLGIVYIIAKVAARERGSA